MNNFKIDILFVLPSLKAGGAERVISFIASNLNKDKFNPTLIVIGSLKDSVYPTDNLNVLFLEKGRVLHGIPFLFTYILKNRPNIIVGSISHVNRILASLCYVIPKIKLVGREASVSSIMRTFADTKGKINIPFFRNYHKYLDAIICQSKDMANDLIVNYNLPERKIHVINNPITEGLPHKTTVNNVSQKKKLITIGRLSKEKGHKRILSALSKVKFDFEYTIIGTGHEKACIMELGKKLDILNKIKFIAHTKEIGQFLLENDIFIQGSYVEGFPNALLESCAVGTPVIAFNAPGGTREIIENGINGFIVEDENEFIEKLSLSLFKTNWSPQQIMNSVEKKYNKNLIINKYQDLFLSLSKS